MNLAVVKKTAVWVEEQAVRIKAELLSCSDEKHKVKLLRRIMELERILSSEDKILSKIEKTKRKVSK